MSSSSRVPRTTGGVSDLRALPLGPVDGFVLSRVNGAATLREIASQTGLVEGAVEESLLKLQGFGLIDFVGEPKPAHPPPPPSNGAIPAAPKARISGPDLSSAAGPPPYDPRELEEACDLSVEQKRRILDVYYRLDVLTFYEILSVPVDADKKTIKRSYFEMTALFHPDRHFRKNLGSFKQKIEIVFGRATEAHDTLTSKTKRPEYDAYLEAQAQAKGIEAQMARAEEQLLRAQEELRRQTSTIPAPETISSTPPARHSAGPAAGAPPIPPIRPSAPTTISTPARPFSLPADPREAREALARRLRGGNSRPSSSKIAVVSPSMPTPSTHDAMEALKRRYEERRVDAEKAQAQKYKQAGDVALARKDMVSAANAYRIATGFDPGDPEISRLFKMAHEAADLVLAETYRKQATYEERSGHLAEGARSWQRVIKAKPDDAHAHDRAAHCLLKSNGNLHEAAALAKRAIEIQAASVPYRVTLIEIYVQGGLLIAAKRELEQAQRMDTSNAELKELAKRLQKAG